MSRNPKINHCIGIGQVNRCNQRNVSAKACTTSHNTQQTTEKCTVKHSVLSNPLSQTLQKYEDGTKVKFLGKLANCFCVQPKSSQKPTGIFDPVMQRKLLLESPKRARQQFSIEQGDTCVLNVSCPETIIHLNDNHSCSRGLNNKPIGDNPADLKLLSLQGPTNVNQDQISNVNDFSGETTMLQLAGIITQLKGWLTERNGLESSKVDNFCHCLQKSQGSNTGDIVREPLKNIISDLTCAHRLMTNAFQALKFHTCLGGCVDRDAGAHAPTPNTKPNMELGKMCVSEAKVDTVTDVPEDFSYPSSSSLDSKVMVPQIINTDGISMHRAASKIVICIEDIDPVDSVQNDSKYSESSSIEHCSNVNIDSYLAPPAKNKEVKEITFVESKLTNNNLAELCKSPYRMHTFSFQPCSTEETQYSQIEDDLPTDYSESISIHCIEHPPLRPSESNEKAGSQTAGPIIAMKPKFPRYPRPESVHLQLQRDTCTYSSCGHLPEHIASPSLSMKKATISHSAALTESLNSNSSNRTYSLAPTRIPFGVGAEQALRKLWKQRNNHNRKERLTFSRKSTDFQVKDVRFDAATKIKVQREVEKSASDLLVSLDPSEPGFYEHTNDLIQHVSEKVKVVDVQSSASSIAKLERSPAVAAYQVSVCQGHFIRQTPSVTDEPVTNRRMPSPLTSASDVMHEAMLPPPLIRTQPTAPGGGDEVRPYQETARLRMWRSHLRVLQLLRTHQAQTLSRSPQTTEQMSILEHAYISILDEILTPFSGRRSSHTEQIQNGQILGQLVGSYDGDTGSRSGMSRSSLFPEVVQMSPQSRRAASTPDLTNHFPDTNTSFT